VGVKKNETEGVVVVGREPVPFVSCFEQRRWCQWRVVVDKGSSPPSRNSSDMLHRIEFKTTSLVSSRRRRRRGGGSIGFVSSVDM